MQKPSAEERSTGVPGWELVGPRVTGFAAGLGVVALFSGFALISRMGSQTDLQIHDLAMLRFGIGAVLLLPVFLKSRLAGLSIWQATRLAFFGGLGFALLAYAGLFLAPATHGAALIHGTLPLTTFILLAAFLPQAAERRRLPGLVLISAGIVLMLADSFVGVVPAQLAGDICLLLASLCWSAYAVSVQRAGIPPVSAAAIVAVLSAMVFCPAYLLLGGGGGLLAADARDLLIQAVFQGVLIGALSIAIYTHAVRSFGAANTALFTASVPCITALLAMPLLGEHASLLVWLGVAGVSLGMVLAARAGQAGRPRTAPNAATKAPEI